MVREMAPGLDNFSKWHVQALDGVGRIDNLPHLRRIGKKRDHLLLLPFPHRRNGRVLLAPRPWEKSSNDAKAAWAVSAR